MNNFIAELAAGGLPWYAVAIAAALAYCLGNINPAIIIGRSKGIDIRNEGSGNAGATNAMRSLGKKAGALTFVIDVVKGWAGYYLPFLILTNVLFFPMTGGTAYMIFYMPIVVPAAMVCGLCVVVGHMYPAFFGFRGGKGVATAFGVLLAAAPQYALLLLAVVIVCTLIFRIVSVSVLIAVAVALVTIFWGGGFLGESFYYNVGFLQFNIDQPLWVIIILALVVWKHRGNIARLAKGEEKKLSFGGKSKAKEKEGAET